MKGNMFFSDIFSVPGLFAEFRERNAKDHPLWKTPLAKKWLRTN